MAEFGIAAKINPPGANQDPLTLAKGVQAIQGAVLQNRLLGMNVDQTAAQRAAAQASIDPATGQMDVDKYTSLLSQGGGSAEALQQAQTMRQQKLQADISKLGLTQKQMELSAYELGQGARVAQGILGTASTDPNALTKDGIVSAINDNLVQPGLVKSPEGKQHVQTFISHLTDDPATNKAMLQAFVNESTDINTALGAISNTDVGGRIVQSRTHPGTGELEVTGGFTKSRTPSEKANLVRVWDDDKKQYVYKTSGEVVGDAAPATPQGPGGGRAPVAAEPAMGAPQAAQGNVEQALKLQNRASIVPQRKAALSELVGTLDKFTTGPKAAWVGYIKGLASQFGLSTAGIDESKSAQDAFNKLAAQIALDQWGSLGGTGSNEQLATAVHANPNEVMSKMGIKNVVALLQGNEDAINAQYSAWQKYKGMHGPASYDGFQEGWNKYFDPRVFQAQHMAPAAVKEMLGGMTETERKTYLRNQSIAKQAGWIGG